MVKLLFTVDFAQFEELHKKFTRKNQTTLHKCFALQTLHLKIKIQLGDIYYLLRCEKRSAFGMQS